MGPEWLVMGGVVAALATAVAGFARRSLGRANPHQDYVESLWRMAAESLGGALTVHPQPALTPRRLSLEAEVDGVAVFLDTRVPVDPTVGGTTYAAAAYALGEGPRFQLTPRRPSEPQGESAALGDPALAQRFLLRTEDPDAVAAAFDGPAKEALHHFTEALVGADGKNVRLEWHGAERRPKVLEAAAQLAARLALFGMGTLRQMEGLEGATLTRTDGGPVVALSRHHVTVLLQGTATRRGPSYSARAEAERELPELDVRIVAGVVEGDLPQGLIEGDMAEPLAAVGGALLCLRPGRVKLLWDEAPSLRQAEAGATLVARLASRGRPGGAFR